MSRTLNLADRVLALGRRFQELGRAADALRMLGRLAGWRQLSAAVAEETQARLADLRMHHGQFAQARRHLAALIAHRPDHARYHYQLATAFDIDHKGSAQAAYEHYQRSLALDPNQADCLSDFGLLALKLGKEAEGLHALGRAVELAPDDSAVVGKLVEGLRRRGQLDEARLTLRAALFRNPRKQEFHKLWNDFRFQQACAVQQGAGQMHGVLPGTDEPVVLPFVGPADHAVPTARDRTRARPDWIAAFSPRSACGPARATDEKRA